MPTKKVYKKDKLVTSIDDIIKNKYKPFIVYYPKEMHILYDRLKIMALASIVSLIEHKDLYLAIIVEEEIIRKTRAKTIPKTKSSITDCKATLDSIYND